MAYHTTYVQRQQYRIHVREYPGEEPAIILMHGFPDNLHLYDRLFAYLSPPRRVVAFDFLGGGRWINPLATPIPRPTKSTISMPWSLVCSFSRSFSSRTTHLAHRPSTGRSTIPSELPDWCC